jgi:uncharacterized protein (TIGR03435 family)
MRDTTVVIAFLIAASAGGGAILSAQSKPSEPTFDVVSIKRNAASQAGRFENPTRIDRPDGGFTWTSVPVMTLIARAYPIDIPADIVGLPEWARREYYNVSATSTLSTATAEDRTAMLRAMLADRFKLVVHVEKREQPVYELALARSDGRLGPGTQPSNVDCAAKLEAQRAALEAAQSGGTPPPRPEIPDFKAPPSPCTMRTLAAVIRDKFGDGQGRLGDLLEAETTFANFAQGLRMTTRRMVVDKTGLTGTYRIRMNFDQRAAIETPIVNPDPDAPPSIFTALREQLGLKLDASKMESDTLIVDRLERPTEN